MMADSQPSVAKLVNFWNNRKEEVSFKNSFRATNDCGNKRRKMSPKGDQDEERAAMTLKTSSGDGNSNRKRHAVHGDPYSPQDNEYDEDSPPEEQMRVLEDLRILIEATGLTTDLVTISTSVAVPPFNKRRRLRDNLWANMMEHLIKGAPLAFSPSPRITKIENGNRNLLSVTLPITTDDILASCENLVLSDSDSESPRISFEDILKSCENLVLSEADSLPNSHRSDDVNKNQDEMVSEDNVQTDHISSLNVYVSCEEQPNRDSESTVTADATGSESLPLGIDLVNANDDSLTLNGIIKSLTPLEAELSLKPGEEHGFLTVTADSTGSESMSLGIDPVDANDGLLTLDGIIKSLTPLEAELSLKRGVEHGSLVVTAEATEDSASLPVANDPVNANDGLLTLDGIIKSLDSVAEKIREKPQTPLNEQNAKTATDFTQHPDQGESFLATQSLQIDVPKTDKGIIPSDSVMKSEKKLELVSTPANELEPQETQHVTISETAIAEQGKSVMERNQSVSQHLEGEEFVLAEKMLFEIQERASDSVTSPSENDLDPDSKNEVELLTSRSEDEMAFSTENIGAPKTTQKPKFEIIATDEEKAKKKRTKSGPRRLLRILLAPARKLRKLFTRKRR